MCGIVGLISKQHNGFWAQERDLFRNMLVADTLRGEDSTGVFGVTGSGEVDILKGDADGHLFTKCTDYRMFHNKITSSYKVVIGHNRKATQGVVKPENAHPFNIGRIVMVHNGAVYNADKLNKEGEVDSEAIASELSKHDAASALGNINGAFALAWYDLNDQTINLARNDKRPLWVLSYPGCWVISSEFGLAAWLQGREGIKPDEEPMSVPVNRILRWSIKDRIKSPEILEFTEYKEPVKPMWEQPVRHIETSNQHTNLPIFGNKGITSKYPQHKGDSVRFIIVDDKDGDHGGKLVLGHPVIDGQRDENIIIRYPMTQEDFNKFETSMYKFELFEGKIRGMSVYQGVILWYVTDVKPVQEYKSKNGHVMDILEAEVIIRNGCPKCTNKIDLADICNTIIKPKKYGGGCRILCKDCIDTSIEKAKVRRLQPVADQPHVIH